jgi:hypothetical protein
MLEVLTATGLAIGMAHRALALWRDYARTRVFVARQRAQLRGPRKDER